MEFQYYIPTTVRSGRNLSRSAGTVLQSEGAEKVFLVTDTGVRNAGILEPVETSLREQGISYEIFDEVIPNPSEETIMRGLEKLRQSRSDHVLAVGGGSSIDTAKGIAVMARNEGKILDYEGVGQIPVPGLPLTVIPTTAGTGSEVTASTIVTNTRTHFKAAVISPFLFPKLALLDPDLTLGLPQGITAATGMDALTHAIESYTSKTATPVSRALAIQAVRMIGDNIQNAYYRGNDITARENMLVASMLAGAAFSQSRLGNVHAISHTLGGVFDIPHGIANASLLPFVMKFNLPACPGQMRDIAKALGEKVDGLPVMQAAEKAVEAVLRMNSLLNIPGNIKDLGVNLDVLPKLVEDSMRSGNVKINPRLTSPDDIRTIIEKAYHGVLD